MTIQLARDLPEKPFNVILDRFNPKYWTIDYNALMVATIIPINARGFKVPAQWRTNSDFMGVRWESEDHYNHEWFKHATDNNYESTILAFRANPSEPDKFTVTITSFDVQYTYRLSPYVLNPANGRYEPLDPLYNTGRSYPSSVIIPPSQWTAIPEDEMVAFKGRRDYVFILDFDDIRIFSQYDGPIIDPKNIAKISFDTLEWSHGLGRDATITALAQEAPDRLRMRIVGSVPGAVLSPGDKLTFLGRFNVPTGASFGGQIYGNMSLPPAPVKYTKYPVNNARWPVARFRTFFFNQSDILQIPGTPGTVNITAKVQYFQGDSVGWGGSKQYEPLPVVSITETYPGTVAVVVDCLGKDFYDPYSSLGTDVSWISDVYASVNYQVWGVGATERQVSVISCTGFGTGEWNVLTDGTIPGPFITCDAFYSRYLQVTSPAQVTDSTKYYVDMTVSGTRSTIVARDYPQAPHGLMMTSGFDDGYNLTPERQVEMVYKLGYRGHWTKYQGMSHYFNGRTAWLDKITGEVIAPGRTNNITVMFAGDHTAAAHFVIGRQPNRGIDMFAQKSAALFGVATGQVQPINGALGSTAADRAAAVDPDDPVLNMEGGTGGLWWWDLEADVPGPALRNCINQASRESKPSAVVWALGVQDMKAIQLADLRDPKPSVARTKLAMKKTFAYMREKWGAALPIIIQGYGWVWGTDATFMSPGQPTFINATRNSWGDVVFTWLSYKEDPATHTYYVDLFHPVRTTEIMRTITVPGNRLYDGLITCDYPVEMNVADAVEAFGDQFPWSFLRWRIRRAATPTDVEVVTPIMETIVPEDNNAFVKKVCVLGINSLAGGYFNDLSDPLNPGGTGNPGRKDVVAASTFRKTFAANAGLRDVEVIPVMTVVGSSPINPMPYQAGFPLDNYWWNPDTKQPGPNLIIADEIVKQIGRPPDYFMESGPGETTGIAFAPPEQRPAILAAFRQSNIEMLAWMRANWGNPALEIWFQGATTSWWGDPPPPMETNAEGTQLLRDTQTSIALEGIGFKLGSYVPNSNLYTTYRNEMAEGLGWIHYTVQGYHDAAREMGESMATDRNMALDPPDWTKLRMPTNIQATKLANKDIVMTWDARPGAPGWYFVNKRGDTAAPFNQGPLTSATYTFTYAAQLAEYGAEAHFMNFEVTEYIPASGMRGPAGQFIGDVESPLDLREVTNLRAAKQFNGDVIFTWDGRPEHQDFYITNKDVSTHAPIFAGPLTTQSYVFTSADQIAHYGFNVSFVEFTVSEYDPPSTAVGPEATFNGNASEPVNPLFPISGFRATSLGPVGFSDVLYSWDASPTPGQTYRIINRRVDTAAEISNNVITATNETFTTAQQVAAYGYTVGYVDVLICEYDPVNNISGPVFNYNGAPTT